MSKYIPELADMFVYVAGEGEDMVIRPANRPIQVRHLFSHTAGFTYQGMGSTGVYPLLQANDIRPGAYDSLEAFVAELAEMPLLFEPGSRYQYGVSNDVLAHLIQVVSGQRLGDFMAERIFEPLGMEDTAYWVPYSRLSRLSVAYTRTDSGLAVHDHPDSSVHRDPDGVHYGGGGLITTAGDYFRFAQMLLNGGDLDGVRILSPAGVALMTRNHLPPGITTYPWGEGYGLGVGVDTDLGRKGVMGNDGTFHWTGADNTHFWADPVAGIVGIFMTQARPFDFDYAHDLRNLTYQALIGP